MNKATAVLDLTLDPEYVQYDRALRRISMESEIIGNFANTVKSIIPKLMGFAKTKFSNFNLFVPTKATVGEFNTLISIIDKYDRTSVEELTFYTPEGFRGNLVEYTHYLSSSLKHCSNIIGDVLDPYTVFLSKIISVSEFQKSNLVELNFIDAREKELKQLVDKTADFFPKGSTKSQSRLGDIISRTSDVSDVVINLVTIRKETDALNSKSVQTGVNNISKLIDTIIKNTNKGELDSISGEVLKSLGESTLVVAREVEFYAITMFRIGVLYNQMVKTTKELSK